jgi:hypothetical protein
VVNWYENDGAQNFARRLVAPLLGARAVFIALIDADDRPDIVATALAADDVAWYQNLGGGVFATHLIDGNLDLAFGLYVADLDGDTDMDVLATGALADELVWYESDLVDPASVRPAAQGATPQVRLLPVVPSPCRTWAAIRFDLPGGQHLAVRIHGADGALVRTLVSGRQDAGRHELHWDRRDDSGRLVPSGVYYCRLRGSGVDLSRPVVLVD